MTIELKCRLRMESGFQRYFQYNPPAVQTSFATQLLGISVRKQSQHNRVRKINQEKFPHLNCWCEIIFQVLRQIEGGRLEASTAPATINVRVWCSLELSTGLREVSQCPERDSTSAFSLLNAPTSTFSIKNLFSKLVWTFSIH